MDGELNRSARTKFDIRVNPKHVTKRLATPARMANFRHLLLIDVSSIVMFQCKSTVNALEKHDWDRVPYLALPGADHSERAGASGSLFGSPINNLVGRTAIEAWRNT